MDRKTFIKKTIRAILITLPLAAITGCSNSDEESENPKPGSFEPTKCVENGAVGNIELNHGHVIAIPKEDVIAAKNKTYTLEGDADHSHTITLTSADFSSLKDPNSLSVVDIYSSTENDHRHSIIFFCAP